MSGRCGEAKSTVIVCEIYWVEYKNKLKRKLTKRLVQSRLDFYSAKCRFLQWEPDWMKLQHKLRLKRKNSFDRTFVQWQCFWGSSPRLLLYASGGQASVQSDMANNITTCLFASVLSNLDASFGVTFCYFLEGGVSTDKGHYFCSRNNHQFRNSTRIFYVGRDSEVLRQARMNLYSNAKIKAIRTSSWRAIEAACYWPSNRLLEFLLQLRLKL